MDAFNAAVLGASKSISSSRKKGWENRTKRGQDFTECEGQSSLNFSVEQRRRLMDGLCAELTFYHRDNVI